MPRRWRTATVLIFVVILAALVVAWTQLPMLGAGGLLHPARHAMTRDAPAGCHDESFAGSGITLNGWRCATPAAHRGTIVYLHARRRCAFVSRRGREGRESARSLYSREMSRAMSTRTPTAIMMVPLALTSDS
ncbi:MAG TPA: hypothetical protein VNC21_19330 [Vicinamibacterales bacterium]|nr:hypothetical protein [Vicinamibacterales bacterium]